MTDSVKTPWKNGIYISDANSANYLKVNGQHVDVFSTTFLDFPETGPIAEGIWTFGEYDPTHEEVQKVAGGVKNNNVDINLFYGNKKNFTFWLVWFGCVGPGF